MSDAAGGSLAGWGLRDIAIATVSAVTVLGLAQWQAATSSTVSQVAGGVIGFIIGYVLCYIVHEWGHLIGARVTGAAMPLARYASPLIGHFDITSHSRRQFLALSWGGVSGYMLTGTILVAAYFSDYQGTVSGGLAVAGLAFNAQSLSVDLPQITRVHRLRQSGAEIVETNQAGASGKTILKRTGQSWLLLSLALAAWHLT